MNVFHSDYSRIKKRIDDLPGLKCKNFIPESESLEYSAATFEINDIRVIFRVAKVTPTKIGQFVTFWKRINNSPIIPIDSADLFDFFIIYVRSENYSGLFIFPKSVLIRKNIISQDGYGGKRAIRVYPLWDITSSKQARITQAWQLPYFMNLQSDGSCDLSDLKKLLSISL